MQEANAALTALHEEFPTQSKRDVNKLKIMVYKRQAEKGPPIEYLHLKIVKKSTNEYVIEVKNPKEEQEKIKKLLAPASAALLEENREKPALQTVGTHTARLSKMRKNEALIKKSRPYKKSGSKVLFQTRDFSTLDSGECRKRSRSYGFAH